MKPSIIYAEELSKLGYGHPLWLPEGSSDSQAAELGDVGYIDEDGAFEFMFNFRLDYKGHQDKDMGRFIPPGQCHYFASDDLNERSYYYLDPGHYRSHSVNALDTGAEAGGYVFTTSSLRLAWVD
jgi:hypothetical protein